MYKNVQSSFIYNSKKNKTGIDPSGHERIYCIGTWRNVNRQDGARDLIMLILFGLASYTYTISPMKNMPQVATGTRVTEPNTHCRIRPSQPKLSIAKPELNCTIEKEKQNVVLSNWYL